MPEIQPRGLFKALFKTVSVVVALGIVAAVAVGGLFFYQITKDLPDVLTLKSYQSSNATEVFSDDGKKIGEFTTERRYPVVFERIPKHVIYAFLAAEDSKFFEHHGIDITGIFRSIFKNIFSGKYAQGGSTITQQIARNILLVSKKKEITRKVREMVLAMRMEKQLTKNEILNLYLTEIYLGHGSYGIGAAAQNYFHKRVEDLTIAEAAVLAGLPQRPYEWDPFRNAHHAKERQTYVLKRMVDEKFIRPDEMQVALGQSLRLYALEEMNNAVAPYFTEYVRQQVMAKYGSDTVLKQGFKIYTTVRYDFQKAAEKAVDRGARSVDKRLGWRGVTKHLDSPKEIETILTQIHDEVMEKLTPERILPPTIEKKGTLSFDPASLSAAQSGVFGATPLREGSHYRAVVTESSDAKATARVGQTSVTIPLNTMNTWVKVKNQWVKRVSDVLKPGDVVEVLVEKLDRAGNSVTASLEQEPEVQGALLSYEISTGFVRALIGGTDFGRSKFNIALQAKRQVGSTFKPVLFAAALDKGFSPSSIVTDSPIVFKFDGALDADSQGESWRPHNYGGKFEGDIPLRLALIRSMNIPTVKLLNEIGVDYGIEYAKMLGITSPLPRDLSIALGSWSSSLEELTRAYAVFPRGGRPQNLVYIKKIVDGSGKILEEYTEAATPTPAATPSPTLARTDLPNGTVISPQTAYCMVDMLKGVVREGTGTAAAIVPASIAGKTGTSNDHKDAWFIGFTPQLMTGVWVGYEKDKPLDVAETGGKAAAPIWADYMNVAVKGYPRTDFSIPEDIVFAYIDKESGKLATPQTVKRVRVAFKNGAVPNVAGDNLLRVGEPGSARAAATPVAPAAVGVAGGTAGVEQAKAPAETSRPNDETSDFLRQGYQD